MKYNLKRSKTLSLSTMLNKHNEEWGYSNKNKENYNGLLSSDRRETESSLCESQLSDKRGNSPETITESSLNEAKKYHRQKDDRKSSVTDINIMSEAFDSKMREDFKKANNDSNTEFWDKFTGTDVDGPIVRVPLNVSSVTLQNDPQRFGNFDGVPHDSDPSKNRENIGKEVKVEKMVMAECDNDIFKQADSLLYAIYFKSASEKRDLNDHEKQVISNINNSKINILNKIANSEIMSDFDSEIKNKEGEIDREDGLPDFNSLK